MGGKKAGTRWQKSGLEPGVGTGNLPPHVPVSWKESPGVVC